MSSAPPLRSRWQSVFSIVGQQPPAPGREPGAEINVVSEDYFATLGVPILLGRPFGPEDRAAGVRSVIIDHNAAQRYWPGDSALGRQVRLGGAEHTIVAVVPTLRIYGYSRAPDLMQLYMPHGMRNPVDEGSVLRTSLLLRASQDPLSLTGALRRAVATSDRNEAVYELGAMEEVVDGSYQSPRTYAYLFGVFASVAVLLAAAGIYGLVAYSVAQRTREMGIRVAVGASATQVFGLVAREGLRLFGLGMGLGLVAAMGLGTLLRSLLFEVSPLDAWVYAGVAGTLGATTVLACLVPARRAARVDPMVALRCD